MSAPTVPTTGTLPGLTLCQDINTGFASCMYQNMTATAVFSGAATGVTPAQFDDSINFATTAFLKTAGLQASLANVIGGTATLSASAAGSLQILGGSSSYTVTLPALSGVPDGSIFTFFSLNPGGAVTIARNSSSDPIVATSGAGVASMALNNGDSLTLVAQKANNYWAVVGGSAQLPYAAALAGANWTTPSLGDNSTKLATTAFVKSALGSISNIVGVSTTTALTSSNVGQLIVPSGSSYTVTLPQASTCPAGSVIYVSCYGSSITIAAYSGDSIDPSTGSPISSMGVNNGDTLVLTCDNSHTWVANGGSAQLPYSAVMAGANWTTPTSNDSSTKLATTAFVNPANSIGSSGYQKLASGLIIQWATFTTGSSGFTNWTFPVAFPNALLSATGTLDNNAAQTTFININLASATTAHVPVAASGSGLSYTSVPVMLIAIGH